ncbi:MAG: arabinogalactan oligomer / maltooligosaccharide transport system substrate-binding protein [Chloroflexota bacterium]|jgi:arabinogalactan oligomer/maltooligosaccharide transport system substrate-binding protein|nr:arabinogalactan oligomer / maltooligosaccharide transport system substrate-binding protein [Chloroflexota bacterium]
MRKLAAAISGAIIVLISCSSPVETPSPRPSSSTLSGDLAIWQTYGSGAPGVTRGEPAAFNSALDLVRAENSDLHLTVTEVGFGNLFQTYQQQAGNGLPDLFIAPNDTAGDLSRAGLALDLTSYFNAAERSRFSELALSGSTIDGKLVQVPESLKAVAVYYDTAKIASFPTTTADLLTRVQDRSIRLGLFQGMYHMFGWWGSFGGQLMDGTGKCIADTTGVADAYSYYAALKAAGATWYGGPDGFANMAAAFSSGAVDAIIDGPWAGGGYLQTHPDNLGVAPLPAGPGGPALPLTSVDGWTVNPNSANVELAVAFAKRMTQPDILKIFADLAVHIPADASVSSSDPLAAKFAAAVRFGLPRPQVPQLGAFWGYFGDALNHVIDEAADPATAVADACAAMNSANGL